MAYRILHVKHRFVKACKPRLGRHDLMQNAELEVADVGSAIDGMALILRRQLSACDKVGHYLAQIYVYALMILEAEVQADAEYIVRSVALHLIAHDARLIMHVNADEPVRRGALCVLVEDGIEYVAVDGVEIMAVVKIDEVMRKARDIGVVMQLSERLYKIRKMQRDAILPLKLSTAVPYKHDEEQHRCHDHRNIAAVNELAEA